MICEPDRNALIPPENTTGQKNDDAMMARAQAKQLQKKENKTLAERLILATFDRKMTWEWEGIEVETFIPSESEMNEMLKIQKGFQSPDRTKTLEEQETEVLENKRKLCEMISGYIIDESITPELLLSGDIGTSFMLAFVKAVFDYESETVKEVEIVKGFRKNKRR